MSLILAVEPDRRRGRQLASLVRRHTTADIVVAQSGAAAVSAIGPRIPDLILTPPLLSPHDESLVTTWLRDLGDAAAHVQTLAVPILSDSDVTSGEAAGSILGKLLDRNESSNGGHGCDPSVFADQIKTYLERAAAERKTRPAAPVASTPAARAEVLSPEDVSTMASASVPIAARPSEGDVDLDLDAISLDTLILEPLFVDAPVDGASTEPPRAARQESVRHADSAEYSTARGHLDKAAVRAWEHELGLGKAPTGAPALWRVSEGLPEEPDSEPVSQSTSVTHAAATGDAAPAAVPTRKRSRKNTASHDDWAFFDPSQTRFKALVRRLDEIVARYAAA